MAILDEGIAMSAYKPSELLQRKRNLIKLVKESNEKYEMELFN